MPTLPTDFIHAISQTIPTDRFYQDPAECYVYGYDNSRTHHCPDAVIFPLNTQEVVHVVQCCRSFGIPLTARGRGTGTPAGAVPLHGGVVLALERMNRCVAFDPDNRWIKAEPGILNSTIQELAAEKGLFWAPDPSSSAFCTLGGNLAYNAAGPRALKYGTTRENTLGLEVVLGTGEVLTTGGTTTKEAVGYDVTRLMIGSEGTLGIITQATLKLWPKTSAQRTGVFMFESIEHANEAIIRALSQPIIPSALEFMDKGAIKLIREKAPLWIPPSVQALLLITLEGEENTLPFLIEKFTWMLTASPVILHVWSENQEQSDKLWQLRKELSPVLREVAPFKYNEDVVVPISCIAPFINSLDAMAEKYGITIINFGHAGNGNIHVNLLLNEAQAAALPVESLLSEVFDRVLALGGSLSGEHGIGALKRPFMAKAISPATLDFMQKLKKLCDPAGILNPGKVLP